jgi:hypothetical protein
MNKEYNIKDTVWIHIGERKLAEGRIVEIIDLVHLEEGHDPEQELYVIELKTGIDDIYEVRSFEQISPDEQGPINLFRKEDHRNANRLMKKIGMPVPQGVMEYEEYPEPTPEQIHAAMERSQKATQHVPLNVGRKTAPRKRFYKKKAVKND